MKRFLFWGLLGGFFLTACGFFSQPNSAPGMPLPTRFNNREFRSNGARIYLTATNDRGAFIDYSGGPGMGGMMMGAFLTCAACHGADGRGGLHRMHMDVMDAPDIRYGALSGEEDGHGADDHADEHNEYGLDEFRSAVVEGRHPNGKPLSGDMPRWRMDDGDLEDLLEYLKSLP